MDSERKADKQPYHALGSRLKALRETAQETVAEASGAVEIETEALTGMEQGKICPSEDILLLLISHFNVHEDEAIKLWKLAGFDNYRAPGATSVNDDTINLSQSPVMVVPLHMPVMYTDSVHVLVNNYGVIVNFMQANGTHQPSAIARVGMSREHAESLIKVLQDTLEQADDQTNSGPKFLPDSTQSQ